MSIGSGANASGLGVWDIEQGVCAWVWMCTYSIYSWIGWIIELAR